VSSARVFLSSILAVALLGALAGGAFAQDEPAVDDDLPQRVLFIGNSHTARHGGLDWQISNMVAAEDPPREFEGSTRTESGVTLEYHYRDGAADDIRAGDFDAVVLQEHLPGAEIQSAASFLEYAGLLHEAAEASGAETILFMTWPQGKRDWAKLDDFVAAHRQAEAAMGVRVAPAGVAFENARAERPDLVLIGEDTVHATWVGGYLVAATVYATLFERSPEGLGNAFGIGAEDAAFLQRIAWQTVSDWRSGIPAAG
jgi:hypothetical protein